MAKLHHKKITSLLAGLLISTSVLMVAGCKGGAAPPGPAPNPPIADGKPAEPTLGKLDEKNFSLEMKASGPYKVGQPGNVEIVLEPKGEFHCNQEYPYKLKLGPAPDGLTYPQQIVKTDAITVEPTRAVMKVPFTANKPGEAKVSGNFYFSVCTSQQCVIENREMAALVKAE
jgi:hypothetical protein